MKKFKRLAIGAATLMFTIGLNVYIYAACNPKCGHQEGCVGKTSGSSCVYGGSTCCVAYQ